MLNKKKLLIVGAGYVGSASAISLAALGHDVFLWDENKKINKLWLNGHLPYEDEDLKKTFLQLKKKKRSPQVIDLQNAPLIDAILICVGTPVDLNGNYNLQQLKSALEFSVGFFDAGKKSPGRIFIRSTLPPNCMEETVFPLVKKFSGKNKSEPEVLYVPEFLREGSALKDLKETALFVVGAKDAKTNAKWIEQCFQMNRGQVVVTETSIAEVVKISSNIFHALKVCFSNEVAMSCAKLKINASEVMRIFCKDNKLNISGAYLKPGFSFGGPCLEKDLLAMVTEAQKNGQELPLLQSIGTSNEVRFEKSVKDLKKLRKKYSKLGVVGTSFKAESIDKRNSPVCRLIEKLTPEFKLFCFNDDHHLMKKFQDFDDFIKNTDAVLLGSTMLTKPQIQKIKANKHPVIDLCINFQYAEIFKDYNFYSSILESKFIN